jgi:ethanolamine utilization protein EutQ (cupin superfamily)
MIFKLKDKVLKSPNKEVFYGNIANNEIKDVYLGLGYLDSGEERKFSPGIGHEEIIYLISGEIEINIKGEDAILNGGEAIHLSGTTQISMKNITDDRVFFITAGGHIEDHHSHSH